MDKKTIFAFLLIGIILILTQTKFYKDLIIPQRHSELTRSLTDSVTSKIDSTSSLSPDQKKTNESPKTVPVKIDSKKVLNVRYALMLINCL